MINNQNFDIRLMISTRGKIWGQYIIYDLCIIYEYIINIVYNGQLLYLSVECIHSTFDM